MRVSLRRSDPSYDPNADYDVFLDGSPLDHVITADEELGVVLCRSVDDQGRFIANGNEIVEVLHTGRVQIRSRACVHTVRSALPAA